MKFKSFHWLSHHGISSISSSIGNLYIFTCILFFSDTCKINVYESLH